MRLRLAEHPKLIGSCQISLTSVGTFRTPAFEPGSRDRDFWFYGFRRRMAFMIAALIAAVAIPWAAPVTIAEPAVGWDVGRSGTVTTMVAAKRVPYSTAWTANFRYRDKATADPPNATLSRIPSNGVVVWASIQSPLLWPPEGRRTSERLSLADVYRFRCCDGSDVLVRQWELYGWGPRHSYSVLVRIYFGSAPTKIMKAQAQRALDRLRLPAAR